ncbi:hypothetical protein ACTXT7_014491 [Hymenolepis weldensis]
MNNFHPAASLQVFDRTIRLIATIDETDIRMTLLTIGSSGITDIRILFICVSYLRLGRRGVTLMYTGSASSRHLLLLRHSSTGTLDRSYSAYSNDWPNLLRPITIGSGVLAMRYDRFIRRVRKVSHRMVAVSQRKFNIRPGDAGICVMLDRLKYSENEEEFRDDINRDMNEASTGTKPETESSVPNMSWQVYFIRVKPMFVCPPYRLALVDGKCKEPE